MSTVRYYRHDDAGAPTLSGEVGSLTNLLRKCLVGVGGIAYGAQLSAGWSEEFIGAAANIAVFRNRQSDGASGCFVRVDDNAPGAAGARESSVTVYSAMTDINTGVGALSARWFKKSVTLSSLARKWLLAVDGKTAWLYGFDNGESSNFSNSFAGFGDYLSLDDSSSYRYFCLGRHSANEIYNGSINAFVLGESSLPGAEIADITGVGAPSSFVLQDRYIGTSGIGSRKFPEAPNPVTGDVYFNKDPRIQAGSALYSGRLRGISTPLHNLADVAHGSHYLGDPTKVICVFGGYRGVGDYLAVAAIDSVGPWA